MTETFVRRVRHHGRVVVRDHAAPQIQTSDEEILAKYPVSDGVEYSTKIADGFFHVTRRRRKMSARDSGSTAGLNPAIVEQNRRNREFWKRRKL
jgi:hypothetical protein